MTTEPDSTAALLRETATRLFQDLCQPAALRAAEGGNWQPAMWRAVEDAGLPLALLPEAGATFNEAMVIVRAAGHFALPLPLPETMLAGWLLARAGLPVPSGPMTVAFGDDAHIAPDGPRFRLHGHAPRIPWARNCVSIVLLDASGLIAILPAAACRIETGENVAGEPRDTIGFDTLVDTAAPSGLDPLRLRAVGAAMRAQQIAGAMERIAAMTTQYAQERIQFGRPLGKFQAVQQNLAVLAGQTAAACAAADLAADAVDDGMRLLALAAGKSRAGEAAGIGAAIAHQVHGAIGFTHEHALHFLTKRLWSWRDEFGNETVWNRLLGRRMAEAGADRLWAELTAA